MIFEWVVQQKLPHTTTKKHTNYFEDIGKKKRIFKITGVLKAYHKRQFDVIPIMIFSIIQLCNLIFPTTATTASMDKEKERKSGVVRGLRVFFFLFFNFCFFLN
jgi:hypothetical protein